MMKKECRVVIYKEGLLGSLFFGEAKADPDKMSQFLSSYTREGWEENHVGGAPPYRPVLVAGSVSFRARTPPLTACAWFTRLSQAFLSVTFQG